MGTAVYVKGAELPDLALTWRDGYGDIIDFSSGFTFSLKVATSLGASAAFTKTTNITGASTAPNIIIAWATSAELSTLTVNTVYQCELTATRTSDSKDRKMHFTLLIEDTIT